VLAVLKHFDTMADVARRISRHPDRLNRIILDKLFERRIRLGTTACLGQLRATVGDQITHGDNLDIGMILKTERRPEFAQAIPDNAHPDLSVGNRFPRLVRPRVASDVAESLNRLLAGAGFARGSKKPGACCGVPDERTACNRAKHDGPPK